MAQVQCRNCNGKGSMTNYTLGYKYKCTTCNGRGHLDVDYGEPVHCKHCGGDGTQHHGDCPTCGGSGYSQAALH